MTSTSIELVTLCENTATFGCMAEWGFGLYINVNGYRILFDTGMTNSVVKNASFLNVDLAAIDAIILSHGHVDHTGGLKNILEASSPLNILAHPEIWQEKLSSRKFNSMRQIGIPFSQKDLEEAGGRFSFSKEPIEICTDVFISGEVPLRTTFETVDKELYTKTNEKLENDLIQDELSLAIKTTNGLVVIVGCAHRGIVNILLHFQKVTKESRIYAVIGGLHLSHASSERIEKTTNYLLASGVKYLACSHCTGQLASCKMMHTFKENFIANNSGTRLRFEADGTLERS